jgi:hypothetical protein
MTEYYRGHPYSIWCDDQGWYFHTELGETHSGPFKNKREAILMAKELIDWDLDCAEI